MLWPNAKMQYNFMEFLYENLFIFIFINLFHHKLNVYIIQNVPDNDEKLPNLHKVTKVFLVKYEKYGNLFMYVQMLA